MKKAYVGILAMLVVLAGILIPVGSSVAQDVAPMEEDAMVVMDSMTFGEMVKQGGWAMYPLGLFSVAMFFFIIRNAMLLREKSVLRPDLNPQIEEFLRQKDIVGLRALCAQNTCLMTSVLDAGLERISEQDYDPVHVMEAVEEAGNEQMVTYMKSINFLSIIGGTSPMVGLLGTVSGMIGAFQTISAGGMGNPEQLAGNIGEALITTATGLMIAIPAMIAYFIFKNDFIKTMSTLSRTVGHFMNVFRNANK